MACNSCAKPYTLFRKEKGCPNCGFSYCSKCLHHTIFINKHDANKMKVCTKCSNTLTNINKSKPLQPPDAYYRRIAMTSNENSNTNNEIEEELHRRLKSLKDDRNITAGKTSINDMIQEKLQNLKGVQPTTSDAELQSRLANLRGVPIIDSQTKPTVFTSDLRTEQEQADDLLKSYLEQAKIDKKYKQGFDKNIEDIESRVHKLKGQTADKSTTKHEADSDSTDEEIEIAKLIEKVKVESSLLAEDDISSPSQNEELPFCEICNEDAKMRCLGCRYLFCKRCFMEHRDDDDGCNKYVPYGSTQTEDSI
ncbi:hypothetical protein evm_005268 [Chilo suppressalis]|nr:hypothetical protein evm_005268 [Chilo suppressalis]